MAQDEIVRSANPEYSFDRSSMEADADALSLQNAVDYLNSLNAEIKNRASATRSARAMAEDKGLQDAVIKDQTNRSMVRARLAREEFEDPMFYATPENADRIPESESLGRDFSRKSGFYKTKDGGYSNFGSTACFSRKDIDPRGYRKALETESMFYDGKRTGSAEPDFFAKEDYKARLKREESEGKPDFYAQQDYKALEKKLGGLDKFLTEGKPDATGALKVPLTDDEKKAVRKEMDGIRADMKAMRGPKGARGGAPESPAEPPRPQTDPNEGRTVVNPKTGERGVYRNGRIEPVSGTVAPKGGVLTSDIRTNLHPGEIDYFRKNPNVTGMAAEDDSVILNPFSTLSDQEKKGVVSNERARIYMRKSGERPSFQITPSQQQKFSGYGSEDDIRATIVGRIISGDPSAGDVTPEQRQYADKIKNAMGIKSQFLTVGEIPGAMVRDMGTSKAAGYVNAMNPGTPSIDFNSFKTFWTKIRGAYNWTDRQLLDIYMAFVGQPTEDTLNRIGSIQTPIRK